MPGMNAQCADDSPTELPPDGPQRKPPWLRVRLPAGEAFTSLRKTMASLKLHTVCESAACPNRGECWSAGTATLMILGDRCTRACRFCNINTASPGLPDTDEPERVAEAVSRMGLRHVVITSVTRDDLPDGGATIWAETVRAVRRRCPLATIEVLTSDFAGQRKSCELVFGTRPDVFGHNVETVPRLYASVRPQATYDRSLGVLGWAVESGLLAKSSLLIGMGESDKEVRAVLRDLHDRSVSMVAIGQYLRPSRAHLPVVRYVTPEEFDAYGDFCREIGIPAVVSGPLVRSSYHAGELLAAAQSAGEAV